MERRIGLSEATDEEANATSITVAFNPDPMRLGRQVATLQQQVDEIIIVDNGSAPSVKSILAQPEVAALIDTDVSINVLVLPQNAGIASAFNTGVEAAVKRGAKFVLLLDDDSIPAADMVNRLFAGYRLAIGNGAAGTVAAVGPQIIDARDAYAYPLIRLGWIRNEHIRCVDDGAKIIACDFLISSGSLVPVSVLHKVGRFDDTLFIDNVDFEWSCRARANNFSLFGVCNATLDHRLGDERRIILNRINLWCILRRGSTTRHAIACCCTGAATFP